MILHNLKTESCPICGCFEVVHEWVDTMYEGRDISSKKVWQHVNGGRSEHREFLCGCIINYVPNYQKEVIQQACRYDPKIRTAEKNLSKAKADFISAINTLTMPEDLKDRLLDKSKDVFKITSDHEFLKELIAEQNEQF